MCPVVCSLCAQGEGRHSFEHMIEGASGCRFSWFNRDYVVLRGDRRFMRHYSRTGVMVPVSWRE